ncbi:universal stress protein [Candidatus Cyanaurora vandensis]|uniref:universal stress protein n=1 Tax=Candidatus Cyanaurora vandensis TaxID=2714958 RepID=UPI00257E3BE6|nr:universal stress protein [Candidatus Cyanaurora vandensis]
MTLLNNILVAIEEGPAPLQMLKILLEMPASRGSRITVLHVNRVLPSAEKQLAGLARSREILAKAAAQFPLGPEYEFNTSLRTGDPKDVVCDVADELKASLVIMGSRGLNNLVAILKNSVSQYVFQRAVCPMLLLRDGVYANRFNRIAVALSDTMAAKFALKTATDLARQVPGSELLLLRIRTRPLEPYEVGRVVDPENESLVIATAAEFVRSQGVAYRSFYTVGGPGAEVCRIAEEQRADLLILGCEDRRPTIARNLPDLDRLLGNSVSDYVRTHAHCPVLLQKTPT